MKIYVVNGREGSGKTTFETLFGLLVDKTLVYSTIDSIKAIARDAIWDGKKDERGRKLLSDLKRAFNEYNDYTMEELKHYLWIWEKEGYEAVFIDSREPLEIARICKETGAKSILIRRPSVEGAAASNSSDANVFNYNYDFIIHNDGDKTQLLETALDFAKKEGFKTKPYYINLFGEIDV